VGLVGAAAAAADGVRANIASEKNKLSMVDLLGFWIARLFSNWLHPFMRAFPKTGANFFRDHCMETQIPEHCGRIH